MSDKSCRIVNGEGGTMIELKSVRVEGDRLVVTGALMGAWDTDMYLDIDGLKAAIGIVDIPEIMEFLVKNVLQIKVSKEG
ncbi:MAG: hypothetical protein ACI36Y_07140 [Coriobacteriales bacterium]